MESVDISKFVRKPDIIKKKIKKVGDSFVANETLYIMFPSRLVNKGLVDLDTISKVIGTLCVYDEKGNYSVINIPARIKIEPNEINDIEVKGEEYTRFTIEKGSTLFASLKVVNELEVVFPLFDLYMLQGKVPWYMNYIDLFNLFTRTGKYAGSRVGKNYLGFESLTAINARDPKNPDTEFRMILRSSKDLESETPEWVGLQNIYYSFKSTLSKIAGAYFKQGIIAAVVKPEDKETDLEHILRS